MAPKKTRVRKPDAAGKAAATKRHPAKKPAKAAGRKQPMRRNPQPRVWRRVARLADEALNALDTGDVKEARGCLEAIRAVGLSVEQG